jgi:hypothetical protein
MADLPYQTKLLPDQESEYQRYARLDALQRAANRGKPPDTYDPIGAQGTNWPGSDYDLRGQWLASKLGLDPGGNLSQGQPLTVDKLDGPHGSDVWKTPSHRTFSNESKYSITGRDPSWNARDQLLSPTGAVLADEGAMGQQQSREQLMNSMSKPGAGIMSSSQKARLKRFADGGVITPSSNQSAPAEDSRWQRLWSVLMGRQALSQAAGTSNPSPSPSPQSQDTSVVARAAADAGRRMEEEKASKSPVPRHACGVVTSPRYGNYGR